MTALTLDLVKGYLRYELDGIDNDLQLGVALQAGIEWVEDYTGCVLAPREVAQPVSAPRRFVELNHWPVTGPVSLNYSADAGSQTVELSLFNATRPATVAATPGWTTSLCRAPATITYTAGFADPEIIPAGLLHGVLLYAGAFDRLRDNADGGDLQPVIAVCQRFRRPSL